MRSVNEVERRLQEDIAEALARNIDRPLYPADSYEVAPEPPSTGPEPVLAIDNWPSNAHLIEDVARLYLRPDWEVLDCTYGEGVFWKRWKPNQLVATDLDPAKSPFWGESVDFTAMPFEDESFDAVVFDPPYKLNGRPDPAEERYGTHVRTRWQDRMALMADGLKECARVAKPKGIVLAKCKDQVVSGAIRWQTDLLTQVGERVGLTKIDRFDMIGHDRVQPAGRDQQHAYGRGSTLLVFRKM